mgnify:CR=1 FL=1
MATTTSRKLQEILRNRLSLENAEFHLEKLPDGKFSGSVVSDSFRGVESVARQRRIWDALEEEFGERSHDAVGTLLAYTKDEWHVPLEGDLPPVKK